MANERLALREPTGEAERQLALAVGRDLDVDGRGEGRIERPHRPLGVEVAGRHRILVFAERRIEALMNRTGHMHPAELVDGRVDGRERRLLGILRMIAGLLEA